MVDARVEDEAPELVPPVEVVLVLVWVPLVAVVAVVINLMLPVVAVEITVPDVITTDDDDRGETEGGLVLMTVATGD